MERHFASNISILLCFLLLRLSLAFAQARRQPLASALFIFGDSTIDPGNNNGLATIVKANFPPYGRDFPGGRPTGRFTNGRLAIDILSGLAGLPDILPANLDPEFRGQKLLTGASFGSSGSGYYDGTSETFNLIPLQGQVENFREYRVSLAAYAGEPNANTIINGSLFAISTGTDDFVLNYFLNPVTAATYTLEEFQEVLLASLREFVQSVYREGGKRLAIIGLPPFGCLPAVITVRNLVGNTCYEEFNSVARSFNSKVEALIEELRPSLPGCRLAYCNIYDTLDDMVKNPAKYGFVEARRGCCGTGLIELSILCNIASPTCPDASKYVFWDSFHPTTAAYNVIATSLFHQFLEQLT